MNNKPLDLPAKNSYSRYLLIVAGLGGLLYGIDMGIIAGALPYLEATSGLNAGQLSFVVAAVLLGSVASTLFAGAAADAFGRKKLMVLSGVLFVLSIPIIALSPNYSSLIVGRLLQGVSAGLIGVVVPLYLAECLDASSRGKGTALFQWLLTMGIAVAAIIGFCFSLKVAEIERLGDVQKLLAFKDTAWRSIFWVSLPPGILFVIGSLFVTESPRWLFRKGRRDAARAALSRSRSEDQVALEMSEMEETAKAENGGGRKSFSTDSLLSRKYVVPFLLACVILACNQATGITSIISYNATILIQAGLSDAQAHLAYVILTLMNFLFTIIAVVLVDKKGRKFLLTVGTAGIIVSLAGAGFMFQKSERYRLDVTQNLRTLVGTSGPDPVIEYNPEMAARLVGKAQDRPSTLVVIYSFGDFRASSQVVRSDDAAARIRLSRDNCVPGNKVSAFFQNPFADLAKSRVAPLTIDNAFITPVPSEGSGWLTASFIFVFMAFFSMGPGVCVWLALSELMPTRIRSNGMSLALLINQVVSTTIAAFFLPAVGQHGYSMVFFSFAGATVIYFVTAVFFLPETKGKTLEEIESSFKSTRS